MMAAMVSVRNVSAGRSNITPITAIKHMLAAVINQRLKARAMAKLQAVECREFIKAVVEKAEAMGAPVSIAVVGPEGHLIAVERMDEAGFITPETAIAKAFTVAAFRS